MQLSLFGLSVNRVGANSGKTGRLKNGDHFGFRSASSAPDLVAGVPSAVENRPFPLKDNFGPSSGFHQYPVSISLGYNRRRLLSAGGKKPSLPAS
jgi:hypothetical protein